jgi:hypothetical protein
VFARHVKHLGGTQWDFSECHSGPIDPEFTRLVECYLASVLESDAPARGWKLPETTLILPWIVRLFPDAYYIYWYRDPRDSILGEHLTDDLADFGVPYGHTEDPMRQRAISWQYQYEIMRSTPSPTNRIDVQFEEFVLDQPATLQRLNRFLGLELVEIPVRLDSIGRWLDGPGCAEYAIFPEESLFRRTTK